MITIEVLFYGHINDQGPRKVRGVVVYDVEHPPWKSIVGIPRTGLFFWEWQYAVSCVLYSQYPRTKAWLETLGLPIVEMSHITDKVMDAWEAMIEIHEKY